ncbi:MAG: hypothetical protein ACXW09_15520 [Methylococcaceae bacterium]
MGDENRASLINKIKSDSDCIFPLSLIHFIETAARTDQISRANLATLMANISAQNSIMPAHLVARDEITLSLSRIHERPLNNIIKPIKNNIYAAFGSPTPELIIDERRFSEFFSDDEAAKNDLRQIFKKHMESPYAFKEFMCSHYCQQIITRKQKEATQVADAWEVYREKLLLCNYSKEKQYLYILVTQFNEY